MSETKPSNPKDLIGASKLPLHLWPETATIYGCLGLMDGALKYGRANFRAVGVRSSIYYDACRRHLNAWFEGQDNDPDSGLPHLAHALACLAILVDAVEANKLNDDRQYPGGYHDTVKKMTPHVERLKALRADAKPDKHYTLENKPSQSVLEWQKNVVKMLEDLQTPKPAQLEAHELNGTKYFDGTIRPKSNQSVRLDELTWDDAEGDKDYWGI